MTVAKCPLCGEKVRIGIKPWVGQEVACPACEAVLEVVGLNPLSLDWPYEDEGYFEIDAGEEAYQYDDF